jgi:hypothetical protein
VIKVCQGLSTGRWFSPGTPVSSTNKTDRHNIIEILLKVELITINQTKVYADASLNKIRKQGICGSSPRGPNIRIHVVGVQALMDQIPVLEYM